MSTGSDDLNTQAFEYAQFIYAFAFAATSTTIISGRAGGNWKRHRHYPADEGCPVVHHVVDPRVLSQVRHPMTCGP